MRLAKGLFILALIISILAFGTGAYWVGTRVLSGTPTDMTGIIFGNGSTLGVDADLTFSGNTTIMTTANVTTLNAPTGRGATYVVATSDAPTLVKTQATYVCDGTADDVQIQAALDAAVSGDSVLVIGNTGSLAATVNVTNNGVTLISYGTTLTATANMTTDMIYVTGDNVTVRGFTLNGNRAVRTADLGDGISADNVTRAVIAENHVFNIPKWGISLISGTSYSHVIDNTVDNATHNNIILEDQTTIHNTVSGNSLYNAGSDGIDLFHGASYNTIFGNSIYNATSTGIYIHSETLGLATETAYSNAIIGNTIMTATDGIKLQDAKNHAITGNTIKTVSSTGINLFTNSTGASVTGNNIDTAAYGILDNAGTATITGNNIRTISVIGFSPFGNTLFSSNVLEDNANGVNIGKANNTIEGNIIKGSTTEGIYFQGGAVSDNNVIADNQIHGGTRSIRFASAGIRNIVHGNLVRNASVSALVIDSNTDQVVVTDNDFRGNTGVLYLTGTNMVIRNNAGYITENSGTATMLASTNTTAVTHGMALTPTAIQLTLASDPGGAGYLWASSANATAFIVNYNVNVTNNTTINWRATAGAGN